MNKRFVCAGLCVGWSLFSSAALVRACGSPQDPNGCAADYFYTLKSYPEPCTEGVPLTSDVFKLGIPSHVPLSPAECAGQKKLVEDFKRKGNSSNDPNGILLLESRLAARMGEYLYKYPLRNLFDGDPKTPWVEWLPGGGIGAALIVGSNDRELTFRGIRVVNGCARDADMFANNNRVKELAVFAPGMDVQYVVLADTAEPQTLAISSFMAAGVAIGIKSVYPGAKFNDTCLSEVRFITDELGEWPAPAKDLVEIHPVYPGFKDVDFTYYTYPSYDFYHEGKKVGSIESDFLSFSVSTGGVVIINEHYGSPPVSVARLNGIKGKLSPARKEGTLPELKDKGEAEIVGWFPGDRVCMTLGGDNEPGAFFMYSLRGNSLKLDKKTTVPPEKLKALREEKSAAIKFLGKEAVYLRQFCPQ